MITMRMNVIASMMNKTTMMTVCFFFLCSRMKQLHKSDVDNDDNDDDDDNDD